ncbi:ABC transporter permease [Cytobacillus spongiae]|uniref:ABC transporter permease n=1 Tax=Cytobacillus spongiae TaxID=2901381 RepID=UPI001F369C2B|nr:ABC transporter permease subunit [Cytobacillus spongiae]UII56166.1 ABC transporter permease [Cytobacillus spongiae]
MNQIHYVMKQQFTLILRSKWLVSFGVLFSFLAIFIGYFGQSGQSGFEGFNRMTASLLNLNLLLIPLISLLVGSLFLAGEKEDRGLMLMLTYPVDVRSVLIGKYMGLFLAMWSVVTFGYGASLLMMFVSSADISLPMILKFYLLSLLLAAIFLAMAVLVGLLSKTRFQALGTSLFVWAFLVLFYEFLVMGMTFLVAKQWILFALSLSIFLNPVELIRVWSILSLDGAAVFGPSLYELTIWANGWQGKVLFTVATLVWILVPFGLSSFVLRRRVGNE